MLDVRTWETPTKPEVADLMTRFACLQPAPSALEIAFRIGIRGGERQVRKWRAGQELHKITFETWHLMRLLLIEFQFEAMADSTELME